MHSKLEQPQFQYFSTRPVSSLARLHFSFLAFLCKTIALYNSPSLPVMVLSIFRLLLIPFIHHTIHIAMRPLQ